MPLPASMLQDIANVSLAFLLFPLALVLPGYVIGWTLNIFDFKQRLVLTRYGVALLISVCVIPILLYLLAYFVSRHSWTPALLAFLFFYVLIMSSEVRHGAYEQFCPWVNRYQMILMWLVAGWILVSLFSLIDLQWGTRLYNNVVSLDFSTRVTLIGAISRSGVPPVNPSYFPGSPQYISSLYYFWYVLCSAIDLLGGTVVDARAALMAGDIWCGLILMCTAAFYLKLRTRETGDAAWKKAGVGVGLLWVSGLDGIPAALLMLGSRISLGSMWPHGDIEHWNEQITAWVAAAFWTPHHVSAMCVCLIGYLLLQYYQNAEFNRRIPALLIAGLAFASAVGLSTWIMLAFSAFLAVWAILRLTMSGDRNALWMLVLSGLGALLLASPFLAGLLQEKVGVGTGIPFAFEVRRFRIAMPFANELSANAQNILYLLLLPLNYFFELGFFGIVGFVWLRDYYRDRKFGDPFIQAEVMLLVLVVFLGSFVRSAIFATNDFGWRVWLLGQFVFLIWAADLKQTSALLPLAWRSIRQKLGSGRMDLNRLLLTTLFLGLSTTLLNVALLRFWPILVDLGVTGFPNSQSPDLNLGERTFDGRLAYGFINANLPEEIIIQQNPVSEVDRIDRHSGLYADRQFAISYNAPFNVPTSVLRARAAEVAEIFNLENQSSWGDIDRACERYFIDVLVVGDLDPLWRSVPLLAEQRATLYRNRYFAVLACGDFAAQARGANTR